MDEILEICNRYQNIEHELDTLEKINTFSVRFFKDMVELFDALTRIKNEERNPSGYDINEAPILGLLVKIWKILKQTTYHYEYGHGEIVSLLDRSVLESATIAKHLLGGSTELLEDYRKCGFKNRLRILKDADDGKLFFQTKAGKRLLKSVNEKLNAENLTRESFAKQKQNRWKLEGKTFYDIFANVWAPKFYAASYGMQSESIHGSWCDSLDYNLIREENGLFTIHTFYTEVDVRMICPLLLLCHEPYFLWLQRIGVEDSIPSDSLKFMSGINLKLFNAFDSLYGARNG